MIVYAVDKGGEYITVEESLRRHPEGKRSIYVNLTNRCTCACTFCLRTMKKMAEASMINKGIADFENGRVVDGKSTMKKLREKHGI